MSSEGTTNEFCFGAPDAAAEGLRMLSAPSLGRYVVDSIGDRLGEFRTFAGAIDFVRTCTSRRGLRVVNYDGLTDGRGDGLTEEERELVWEAIDG